MGEREHFWSSISDICGEGRILGVMVGSTRVCMPVCVYMCHLRVTLTRKQAGQ